MQRVLNVPIATVSLIDGHRQWFKSYQGFSKRESPRTAAICSYAIAEPHPLVVTDTLADARFAQNPHVVGPPYVGFYAGFQLRTRAGHAIGTLCAMDTKPRGLDAGEAALLADLACIVMSELELRVLSTSDGLTSALSRRAFRDEGGRAIALARRHKQSLSCILCHVDHLGGVNETHGHATGNEVLVEAVATWRANLRQSDLLGRVGGDEFAILLPQTGSAAALRVAEKLRAAFAQIRIASPAGPVAVSASFGVAAVDSSVGDLEVLLDHAKTALAAARAEGGNRCAAWAPAVEAPPPDLRRRVLKAGRMFFNGGNSTIDCTVRTLSGTGGGLAISSSAGVPEQFKLQIEADGFYRMCRIVTKTDTYLEVAFD